LGVALGVVLALVARLGQREHKYVCESGHLLAVVGQVGRTVDLVVEVAEMVDIGFVHLVDRRTVVEVQVGLSAEVDCMIVEGQAVSIPVVAG